MRDLSAVLQPVRITEVWTLLGGGVLRGNRGQAFWRGGDGHNVALDEERGLWCDYASGNTGGDCIALIRTVLGCDFRGALEWLKEHFGIEVEAKPLTPGEKRRYAAARREAEQFTAWRNFRIQDLRECRDFHLHSYHWAARLILEHSLLHPKADVWATACEQHEARWQELDTEIDALVQAPPKDLINAYRASTRSRFRALNGGTAVRAA